MEPSQTPLPPPGQPQPYDVPQFNAASSPVPPEVAPTPPEPVSLAQPSPMSAQPMPRPAPAPEPHPMVVMQNGEQLICRIKRHPAGIITSYIVAGLFILVAAAAAVFLVPKLTDQYSGSNAGTVALAAYGLLAVLGVGAASALAVMSKVYWQNEWIVTSDSITQITQTSLFGRQSSQLSLGNLEDVTVDQDGLLQHMFGFGTLRVETAGERSKFSFQYCPNPTVYARQILEARENFMNHRQYRTDL